MKSLDHFWQLMTCLQGLFDENGIVKNIFCRKKVVFWVKYRISLFIVKSKSQEVINNDVMTWKCFSHYPWWRFQMETFSALLVFCAGNSPVTGEFTAQRPVTRSFDVFFDLRLNQQLSKTRVIWDANALIMTSL